MQNVLAILLAGGVGERLSPLTQNTAKPAVPFGGAYRIIDFTLSNCINSDIRRIFILTMYKALELTRHIREGWTIFSGELNEFIEVIPPMKRVHADWYLGTADAVYQNIESVAVESPDLTLILAGDQIYKMDYHEMVDLHIRSEADITIATIQIPPEEAPRFGIVDIDAERRVIGFEEKPKHGNPTRSVFNRDMVSASMGIYVFNTKKLIEALVEDAADPNSSHDFGKDVLPAWIQRANIMAYDFRDLNQKTVRYWRDVGTLDAYYEANMDLVNVTPEFNLYDKKWPVRTRLVQQPPAKFVFAHEGRRMGVAMDSIVSAGCIVSGGRVTRSVLSPGVRVNSYCEVDNCILMSNCEIGRYSRLTRTIVPAGVMIPENSVIGYDLEKDRDKGYTISDSGVVVVPPPPDTIVNGRGQ
ncbi:MAG TPA: glucose-1-phosphate adenylyltransferase [Bryobacteraceae bacterium]|nr:glucose-1-phosphate adenylyltransferase [Bryobacteraceae bacterium]